MYGVALRYETQATVLLRTEVAPPSVYSGVLTVSILMFDLS